MNFAANLKMLDAERLQQTAKATIQSNGRLSLTVEAGRLMHLSDDKSIVIFAAENGDLGAIVSHKGDRRAFELKKAGAYFYITFKTYLQEMGLDYKNRRIVYDIIATDEKIDGKVLYRFSRRVLPKESKELPITEGDTPEVPVGDNAAEVAPVDADDSKEPVESEGE